jgi:hypothetical protein
MMAPATLKRLWDRNMGRKSSNAGAHGAAVPLIISDILSCFCWGQDNTVEQGRTLKLQANLLEIRVVYPAMGVGESVRTWCL